ncbi:MAG: hypothetical protein WA919_21465 [Coleofasciculaceae cyanobacterium]
MTPTLFGRWQTRLFLLATVGIFTTLPFYLGIILPNLGAVSFWILAYVALFGLVWDVLYIYLQRFRWDRDWPGILQLLTGVWEGLFLACLLKFVGLPGVPKADLSLFWFTIHYSFVWLVVYLASQSFMRILFPRWRFRGGRLL